MLRNFFNFINNKKYYILLIIFFNILININIFTDIFNNTFKNLPIIDNLSAFLNTLTLLEESAFLHIIIFLLIIVILFNIIGALFANELIKYFNLEN